MNEFVLECTPEALHGGIIVAIAFPAHGLTDPSTSGIHGRNTDAHDPNGGSGLLPAAWLPRP